MIGTCSLLVPGSTGVMSLCGGEERAMCRLFNRSLLRTRTVATSCYMYDLSKIPVAINIMFYYRYHATDGY